MKKLKHENIVKLYNVVETQKQLHLIMEHVDGTSLRVRAKKQPASKFTEQEARRYFIEILLALKQCH
jgi:serine/threonine protein kinase